MRVDVRSGHDRGVTVLDSPPRATRSSRGRVVAGVARGLAEHLRLPVWLVRLVFVVLAFAGGIGLLLYAIFWAVLPLAPESESEPDADERHGADLTRLLGLAALVLGVGLLLSALGVEIVGGAVVPILIAVVGAALVWQQADADQRARWSSTASRAARQTAGSTARAGRWRIIGGLGLVVLGLVGVLVNRTGITAAVQALATALLLGGGLGLVVFPWFYRRSRELAEQRRELIRSEERADIATHVHDSVLQTLTLIQRNASDPREVTRLARLEERALRSWLYAPEGDPTRTFAARLQRDAAEVESAYGATLEVVVVGDGLIDSPISVLLAATRESMVNAAKHGGGSASVYAEVGDEVAEVYVRDRGPGFDPLAVAEDRHGLSESVVGRMERAGGMAEVVSRADVGTEIRLRIPRSAVGPS